MIPIESRRLLRRDLNRVMERLALRRHHVQDIVLRRIWRDVQSVKVKVGHVHARMTEAVFSRLGVELIFIFDVQNTSRLDADHGRRVVVLITKFGFAGDRVRCGHERDRRPCLWQFRKYSILATCCGDKQSDACYPVECSYRELWRNLHEESYRLLSGIATAQAQDFVMPPLR